jgi:exonuclease III
MKCIFWNIRGLANSPSKLALKRLILKNKPNFIFIAEPWMNVSSFPQSWLRRLRLKIFATNCRNQLLPNLWCLCHDHLDPLVIDVDDQQVSIILEENGKSFGLSAVYASTSYIKRRELWQKLSLVQQNNNSIPWCFIGDFNTILGTHEYRGAHTPSSTPMTDFLDWTDSNSLVHLPTRGVDFTWHNGRRGYNHTEKRLDRSICSLDFIDTCSSISCSTLTKSRSDHFPLLLEFFSSDTRHVSQFRFMSMWLLHPNLADVVKECWNTNVIGCPMFVLSKKLKILKDTLKVWNKDVFGNVHDHLKLAEDKVNSIQADINSNGHSDRLMDLEKQAQIDLELALNMEDAFWKEKSKVKCP